MTVPRAKAALAPLVDKMRSEQGQGTVEYAVVLAGVLCMVVALGVLAKAMGEGLFACAHVGLPSPAACCLGVGGGRVRVLVCKMFREDTGQATVEAAFALPIALALVILLVQPGILLYDRIVMQQAAAETCRLLATTPEGDPSGVCRAFALRRLGAVPEQDCFHVHQGGCTWEVELEGGESSDVVRVRIATKAKPLPLIGVGARLLGVVNDGEDFEVSVEASAPVQPAWVAEAAAGRSPSEWIGAWADEA